MLPFPHLFASLIEISLTTYRKLYQVQVAYCHLLRLCGIKRGNRTLVACYGIIVWYHGYNVT